MIHWCQGDTDINMKVGKSKHLVTELKRGWVPLVAVFCSNFVILASQKTFPVLYIVIKEQYQSSATATGWLSGLLTLLTKCLGPVSSLLIARFSVRPTAIAGVAILSVGAISCAFVNSLALLYITYSILIGVGSSLVYVASYLVVSNYFNKYKSFSFGIINVGYSLGIFATPILCDFLISHYGLSGQFLIMSGLMLNGFIFTGLFRPLPNKEIALKEDIGDTLHTREITEDPPIKPGPETEKHSSNTDHDNINGRVLVPLMSNDSTHVGSKSNLSISSMEIIISTEDIRGNVTVDKKYQQQKQTRTCSEACSQSPFVTLFKNTRFSMFCILTFCHHAGIGIFYTYIKAFALEKGVEDHKATMLVSMSGLAEMCGNLVLPFISDLPVIRKFKFYIYLTLCFASGIMFLLYPICSGYTELLAIVFVTIFMVSQLHTLRIPFAISMTGVTKTETVSALIGLITFCMGTGQGIGPIIGGVILDELDNYDLPFIVTGIFFIGSAILFTIQSCILYLRKVRADIPPKESRS